MITCRLMRTMWSSFRSASENKKPGAAKLHTPGRPYFVGPVRLTDMVVSPTLTVKVTVFLLPDWLVDFEGLGVLRLMAFHLLKRIELLPSFQKEKP